MRSRTVVPLLAALALWPPAAAAHGQGPPPPAAGVKPKAAPVAPAQPRAGGGPRASDPVPLPGSLGVDGKFTILVTELPFKVTAPAGFKFYVWELPETWRAAGPRFGDAPSLTVVQASGQGTVYCAALNEQFKATPLSVDVTVGGVPPPQPPGPPPVTDPLVVALQTAYNQEKAASPATAPTDLAALRGVYAPANVASITDDPGLTKMEQLDQVFGSAVTARVSTRMDPLRKAIQAELRKTLPAKGGTLDAAGRALAKAAHTAIGTALGGVRP